ncbi:MFS transporter [Fictibacillus sp. KIGAM418]|uniref:MFS transporter n=1 Tax=Fictibacillus marinisediminis TaxID=2878389 RepID=A0A9X2BIS5_9BACL|nr:MFS transporter [Fictibacillus marinisediminis]MCK6258988.1 MFS transporter [Fictibacillus marinisediminis]
MSSRGISSKLLLLESRPLRHLFFARSISILGDMLTPIALAFAVLSFSGSASGLGIVLAARALPSLVLMLLGGVIGDRYPRRAIMIISNILGFLSQGLIGLLLITDHASVWNIALLTALRGVTSSFFNPASTGAIAQVAPDGKKQEAFALFAIAGNIAEIAGPVLAGIVLVYLNPGWILVADAFTFLLSAMIIMTSGPLGNPKKTKSTNGSVFQELREGLAYVTKQTWLTVLIVSASVFQFLLLSSLGVLGPLVAEKHLGGAPDWALISTALGIGSIAGSIMVMYFKPKRPLFVGFLLLIIGSGPTLLLLALPASTPIIAISEFISGFSISFFSTLEATAISRLVPNHLMSRVDSINRFGSMALKPLGMAIIGPVSGLIGVEKTLILAASITILAVSWPLTISSIRNLNFSPHKENDKQLIG